MYNLIMKKQYTSFEEKINNSFRKYSRLPFLSLVGILVVVLFFVSINKLIIMPKKAQNLVEDNFNNLIYRVDDYLNDLYNDNSYQQAISNPEKHQFRFTSLYYGLKQVVGMDIDYAIFNNEQELLYLTNNDFNATEYASIYNRLLLKRMNDNQLNIQVGSINYNARLNTLVLGWTIPDGYDNTTFLLLYLNPNSLKSIIDQYHVNQLVITDGFGYVVTSTSDSFSDKLRRFNNTLKKQIKVDNVSYRDNYKYIMDDQLIIHALSVKENLGFEYFLLVVFVVLGFAIIRKANNQVGKRVGEEVSGSIHELVKAIDHLKEGALGYQSTFKSDDEMGYVIDEFNEMSHSLDMLVKRNNALTQLSNKAQIKLLEAQFNPHFLYNSLETIRYLMLDDKEKATTMILNLTYLLRYSIDVSKSVVLLEEDLGYVLKYLDIIKTRLNERFNYIIDIEESVKKSYIPRLLLQPLIENSVKHGFKNKDSLNISIYGYILENNIYLGVNDDGGGISDHKLKEILETIDNYENPGNSFGIHNINQRLKLLYGPKSDLCITSTSEGTNITISLPKEKIDV